MNKNKWKRCGRFQVMKYSGRHYDNSLDGRDILMFRVKGVCAFWAETPFPQHVARGMSKPGVKCGLGAYVPDGKPVNPVTVAHAIKRALLARIERA